MRKILWLLAATLTLSACSGAIVTPQPTTTEVVFKLAETPMPANPECTWINAIPTPGADEESLFPPVEADDMVRGPADAAVTIIEYGDYQ